MLDLSDVVWIDASPTDSSAEIKTANVVFNFCGKGEICIENALETEFDVADVWIGPRNEKLKSSRLLHSWTDDDLRSFKKKSGLWMLASDKEIFLIEAKGDPKYVSGKPQWGIFFVLGRGYEKSAKKENIKISISCMN